MRDSRDLDLITNAARQAGEIAKRYFGGNFRLWEKGKGQPVTEADLAIDEYLRGTLTAARPDYGWLSEESVESERRIAAARTFIVDPIDGTVAFMRGHPHFTICIAVVEKSRPLCAVVLNPILDECFSAALGCGARLNDATIHVTDCHAIEGCRILASKTVLDDPIWSKPPNRLWPPMQVEQRNSLAYRLALVAAGRFDAMLTLSATNDWDVVAGDLVVHEAGGRVTDNKGALLRYNDAVTVQRSVVAAGPLLHPLLIDRLRHLTPPDR